MLSPPPDLFLLEDANSIQCALQWVLRHILAATIDHRQASLLLYGLQIAAGNIKLTRFQPSYEDTIRALPADHSAETARETAQTASISHPQNAVAAVPALSLANGERPIPSTDPAFSAAREQKTAEDSHNAPTCHAEPVRPGKLADESKHLALPTLSPDFPQLPTGHHPLTSASRPSKRISRRPPTASLPADHQPLSTPRPALSLMFQREVRRHLDRLNFPASPESGPET